MKKKFGSLVAVAMIALAAPAHATVLYFTISGDYDGAFQLDSSPTPLAENVVPDYLFGMADVPFASSSSGLVGVTFFNASATGGILINDGFDYLFDANGAQLYTGPESAPTFKRGTFALTGVSIPGKFFLSISAVPEPASWAMMVAGFALAGGMMRDRRRVAITYNG